jgi:hypothetical protein
MKPRARLQENLQAITNRPGTSKKAGSEQAEVGENDASDGVGGLQQATQSAVGSNGSLIQKILRTMLQETSSHLMSEQKQMLERLWMRSWRTS